jgi:hypothetical protein
VRLHDRRFRDCGQRRKPYQLNGQQYIVVAISSAAHTSVQTYTGELVAFRSP